MLNLRVRVAAMSAGAKKVSQSQINNFTSAYVFLQSLTPTSPDDDWVGMSAVEEVFYVNLGQRDVSVFRRVREETTNMGFIEWGQIDTETFGDSEVELASPSDFDSTASNALLRLTNQGSEMLSRGPPANVHGESTHVESQGAGRSNVSRSQESQSGVRSTISTSAYVFLQSLTPTSPDDDWVGMSAVEEVFYVNLGQRDVSVFRRVREQATSMGFIEWGQIDTETFGDSEVELASPSDFDSTASNALLRLTNQGSEMLLRGPPANVHGESTPVASQGAVSPSNASLEATAAVTAIQHYPLPAFKAPPKCPDMKSFLQCIFGKLASSKPFGWVSMNLAVANFALAYGPSEASMPNLEARRDYVAPDLASWCLSARQDKLLEWGRSDPSKHDLVQVCGHGQVEGHSMDAFLRLSDAGHNVAYPNEKRGSKTSASWWHSSVESGLQHHQQTQSSPRDDSSRRSSNASAVEERRRRSGRASISSHESGGHHHGHSRSSATNAAIGRTYSRDSASTARSADRRSADSDLGSRSSRREDRRDSQHSGGGGSRGSFERSGSHHSEGQRSNHAESPAIIDAGGNPDWFLPNTYRGRTRCQHFKGVEIERDNCRFGIKCHYAHVQPRFGSQYMDYWYEEARSVPVPLLDNVIFGKRTYMDEWGRTQKEITAVYQDPNTMIYYLAEGGKTRLDGQFNWYPTTDAAKSALEFSYVFSQPRYAEQYRRVSR
ncbi:expressed unknown protein [Seminavis robusta]|uniref:C3H1-type domain-containing protein n=1 Tax=Seminavis robusta TaxID=568900 RepID=A0A9N8HTJ4_9STRA|nr:expressed unknown protein [Seminavis robusta]|eukprot:Sro1893_g303880.1 n/a (720) ;mRNA; r:1777-3936